MHQTSFLLLLLFMTTTTNVDSKPRSKFKKRTYTEDLSSHRIKFTPPHAEPKTKPRQKHKAKKPISITPIHDITKQLHDLLVDLKAYYAMIDTVQGYTIQVYAGGSRDLALKAKNRLYTHYPTSKPEVQYNQPNFTVRIGKFLDRLEAYKFYAALKKMMPHAIIRPAHFPNEPGIFDAERPVQDTTKPATAQEDQLHGQDIADE